jgi:hypothetical protein
VHFARFEGGVVGAVADAEDTHFEQSLNAHTHPPHAVSLVPVEPCPNARAQVRARIEPLCCNSAERLQRRWR